VRDSENNMSVWYVKHVSFNFFSPPDGVVPAAGRAESIFTAVVYFGSLSALRASKNIYAKSCSST
jgi:hypothetical protein